MCVQLLTAFMHNFYAPLESTMTRLATTKARVTIILLLALPLLFVSATAFALTPTPVNLGTTSNFAVLAGSTITNTGATTITGDVGLYAGSAVTGFPPGTYSGVLHIADGVAGQAKTDLVTAYNDAAGRTPATSKPAELGGTILTPGVYTSGTFEITGTLTLDGEGDPDAVFIFQMGSTLTAQVSSKVVLTGDAQACNVFWQVGSSATLKTDSIFKGTIMAMESITLNTRAAVDGRVLARDAAVTMDTNTITRAVCQSTPPSTTSTTAADSTTSTTAADSATSTTLPGSATTTMPEVETDLPDSHRTGKLGLLMVGGVLLVGTLGVLAVRRSGTRRGSSS